MALAAIATTSDNVKICCIDTLARIIVGANAIKNNPSTFTVPMSQFRNGVVTNGILLTNNVRLRNRMQSDKIEPKPFAGIVIRCLLRKAGMPQIQ